MHYLDYIPILQPDIIIIPKTIDNKKLQEKLRFAPGYNPLIVCIPTEFGILYTDMKLKREVLKNTYKSIDIRGVNLLLTTTEEELKKQINNHIFDEKTLIKKVGHPRIDFYSKKYNKIPPTKNQLCKHFRIPKKYKFNVVTIATSFPNAHFYNRTDCDEFIKKARHLNSFKIRSPQDLTKYVNSHYFDRESMCDLTIRLAKKHPSNYFLIKVHPAEKFEYYKEKLNLFPKNVGIVNYGEVTDLLKISTFHIQSFCTTGAESILYGIPTLHFQSESFNPAMSKALIKEASYKSSSIEEAMAVFEMHLSKKLIPSKKQEKNAKLLKSIIFGENIGGAARLSANAIYESYISNKNKLAFTCTQRHKNIKKLNQFNKWGDTTFLRYLFFLKYKIKEFLVLKKLKTFSSNFNPLVYTYPNSKGDIKRIKKYLNLR